ncbi:prolyl oligopeptidase family serine peptidase [Fimbriiglobus ruber]|uniref:Peptidase S9 prolyl oligopeptidase catalytic domain-containing protein n=1 Tax=Fimbriiglobus ruber TaxID=1908690 RepID=A0A225DM18_9BACT|nr:prolyl oligopeptidase family serine peptidase [Fimbriiglobus ruber]OWK37495.1 hypothetical protein FRUB_06615 [Fimbriiglobus ruber]
MAARLKAGWIVVLFALTSVSTASADGPTDNNPAKVRPVPPKGITLSPADEHELMKGAAALRTEIRDLAALLRSTPALLDLLPDIEIYEKAVRYAVEYDEIFASADVVAAKELLKEGLLRASHLRFGKAPWTTATGLVVRGYRSKIDGSVQPYGLVIPAGFVPAGGQRYRLDFWWHGRGATLSEVNFLRQRRTSAGAFTPPGAIVVHPYGRYCNANKFAGEIDTLECLDHVRRHYPIDDSRVVARGFSMGGAACWQFAVHYPTLFCAAAPGAGFSETPEFLKVFQKEEVDAVWYEQKLWHWYNATDSARNLFNLPTVAYSGEVDSQKQAADAMAKALKAEGIELTHLIGPKTAHSYEPAAKAELNRRIDAIVEKGRDPLPAEIRFATYTLRYNQRGWITVDGLDKHWDKATVNASLQPATGCVLIQAEGATALTVRFPPGSVTTPMMRRFAFAPDEKPSDPLPLTSDRSLTAHFQRAGKKWRQTEAPAPDGLAKRPGLQGPIDDAFLDAFVMVAPTGKPLSEKAGKWATAEMARAVEHWRKQFRGDARVLKDADVSADDIAANNLVLWGDPKSNAVLARIADKLPIKWTKEGVAVGNKTYDVATHVPLLIYPNPLNPRKYVVINSGFTFREYDYLNNARQVPKLPDYAVVDLTTPPGTRYAGKIVRAGFFGEKWELLRDDGK